LGDAKAGDVPRPARLALDALDARERWGMGEDIVEKAVDFFRLALDIDLEDLVRPHVSHRPGDAISFSDVHDAIAKSDALDPAANANDLPNDRLGHRRCVFGERAALALRGGSATAWQTARA